MKTYEHQTAAVDDKGMKHFRDALTAQLNRWGKEGWELVSSTANPCLGSPPHSLVGPAHRITLIFKGLSHSGEAAQI